MPIEKWVMDKIIELESRNAPEEEFAKIRHLIDGSQTKDVYVFGQTTQRKVEEIVKLKRMGLTYKQIEKEARTTSLTISRCLEYAGFAKHKIRQNVEKDRENILKLVKQGYTRGQIANKLNIKVNYVTNDINFLKRNGHLTQEEVKKIKVSNKSIKDRQEKIRQLKLKGYTNKEVIKELNLKTSTLNNDLHYLKTKNLI